MADISKENFIPVNKSEIVLHLQRKLSGKKEKKQFAQFCMLVSSMFHYRYHTSLESLKELYIPFDPDADRTMVSLLSYDGKTIKNHERNLYERIEELLVAGNYTKIHQEELQKAFSGVSPWGIQLDVDFNSYQQYSVYYKGKRRDSFEKWFLFRKKVHGFDVYGRVFFLFRLNEEAVKDDDNALSSDKIYLKIFKNVPELDLEMLFPNMKIRIRWVDKAKVIVPLVAGGASSLYKIISYVLVQGNPVKLWSQIGFWSLVGGFFIFALKSFMSYKNTVEKYLKTLATSLYFQNLDNNSGVITCLTDEAEEQECREAILAYFFLLTEAEQKHSVQSLDERIERFFREEFSLDVDFEVDDAVRKLKSLSLLEKKGKSLRVVPLFKALRALDEQWDGLYSYRN